MRAVVDGCKFQRINDISPSRVQHFLAELRADGKSIATSNHYLRAVKMFVRWMLLDRRTGDDPIAHMSAMNAETDPRRVRRPMTQDELAYLIASTQKAGPIQHVSGPDRAILYIIGTYTGFRRNEIASVSKSSFDFESEPATLTVEAAYSKHRRNDVIPLRGDFATMIQAWIAAKKSHGPKTPLLDVRNKRTAEMLKKDLDRAREEWIEEAETAAETKKRKRSSFLRSLDEQGRCVDFHALRKTFITNLSLSGASPKTAQTLARHSDINLTMNTYTMLGIGDQASAVEALPAVPRV